MSSPVAKAQEIKKTFRYECSIVVNIKATQEKIWDLLTSPADFHKWNSTVLSLEGNLANDEVIRIKSVLDKKRTFLLRVSEFGPPHRMVWSDGTSPFFKGVRIYTLTPKADGTTDFSFVEVLSGWLLPIVGTLPDFPLIFERVGSDLKAAAEMENLELLNS